MKPKLLMYSDFFLAGTGFGTVSKYVIKALKDHYDIDQLAINNNGEFFDNKEWPVQVSSSKLLIPSDPYGSQMFINAIQTGKYDYVWIMNDTFVVEKLGKELPKLFQIMKDRNQKIPVLIYYFPIDCQLPPDTYSMLETADHVVAYCKFGKEQVLKRLPHLEKKMSIITHGVDPSSFFRVSASDRSKFRQQYFKIEDDKTFLWINVNRNTMRKDIAKNILAFKSFKQQVPNSKLYLHTAIKDTTIDLGIAVEHLGLSKVNDVLFPSNYAAHKPFPSSVLNAIYNCADGFITTTLGEGWGLTHPDAALIDLPIVAPTNSCFPEQLDNGNRGYLYPCKEETWVDNSGYRSVGRTEDIVSSMVQCYAETKLGTSKIKTDLAKKYVHSLDWKIIGKQWVDLLKSIKPLDRKVSLSSTTI